MGIVIETMFKVAVRFLSRLKKKKKACLLQVF